MRRFVRVVAVVATATTLLAIMAPGAIAAKGGGSGSNSCSKRNPCTTADTTAPQLTVSSPSDGTTVSGLMTVAGSASDNVGVTRVEVQVDDGANEVATGTTSWSSAVDTRNLADGSHTITARAFDAAGLAAARSISVTIANGSVDSAPPVVAIEAPTDGASVKGTISVVGSATDDSRVVKVEVAIDGSAWVPAAGTTSWSASVDTRIHPDGPHTIVARAVDASGREATQSTAVVVDNASMSGTDILLIDPAGGPLETISVGELPAWGDVTAHVYAQAFSSRRGAYFRNSRTGASSFVTLPSDSTAGWSSVSSVMSGPSDLWVFGGNGPLLLRHYSLAGGEVPTMATLVSTSAFGDSDSRRAELLHLQSGGLLAIWAQQGNTGAQGLYWAYRAPTGSAWAVSGPLSFMPTKASKRAAVQHPADGSIWLFHNPDAWGRVGVVHLTETDGGVVVDWTDPYFIQPSVHGSNAPDPENPDLAVAPDISTGTIVLAYQSATRRTFSVSPPVIGSHPVVARITASGALGFTALPIYVERISSIGLVVEPGQVSLIHRPIDESTLAFDRLFLSVHREGAWEAPEELGRLHSTYEVIGYGQGRTEVAARLSDGHLHLMLR